MDYTNTIILRGRVQSLVKTPYGYYFILVQDKMCHHIVWKTKQQDLLLVKHNAPVKVEGELRYDEIDYDNGNKKIVPRIHTYNVVAFG